MYYLYIAVFLWLIFQSHNVSAVALSAQLDAEINASALNVRTGPGMRYDVLQALPRGTPVTVLESQKLGKDEGTTETWSKIIVEYEGKRILGWVCDLYLTDHKPPVAEIEPEIVPDEPEVAEAPDVRQVTDELSTPSVEDAPVIPGVAEAPVVSDVEAPAGPEAGEGEARPAVASAGFEPIEPDTPDFSVLADIEGLGEIVPAEIDAADALETVRPFGDVPPAAPRPDFVERPDERLALRDPTVDAEAPEPAPIVPPAPLTYTAERIDCARGYFFGGLTSCTAEVSYQIQLPEEFAAFAAGQVAVVCDVAFTYRSNGTQGETTEVVTERVIAELARGIGQGSLSAEIDFRYRVPDVSEVTVEETLCRLAR